MVQNGKDVNTPVCGPQPRTHYGNIAACPKMNVDILRGGVYTPPIDQRTRTQGNTIMATKFSCSVTTPFGTFTRKATKPYTFAVVSEPVSRFDMVGTPDELRASIVKHNLNGGGVMGRFAKDNGYIVSYHSSEASARKAADKGNTPYFATRTLGVFPVEVKA